MQCTLEFFSTYNGYAMISGLLTFYVLLICDKKNDLTCIISFLFDIVITGISDSFGYSDSSGIERQECKQERKA